MEKYIQELNFPDKEVRLHALEHIKDMINKGELPSPPVTRYVNNHIHTTYSFSPYSPSKAVYMAYMAGLSTAGIMDHDSISGAEEFIRAGEIMGIATTAGVECRVKMTDTALTGRSINNCDQKGVAYMAVHGIPHGELQRVRTFFMPYTEARNVRNRKMTETINKIMKPYGIAIDFEKDIRPLSLYEQGGSVTERHLLYALALAIIERFGAGNAVVDFLQDEMKITLSDKLRGYLLDAANLHYAYDLLGILKSDLLERLYVDATDECPDVREVIALSKEIGAISAYAYLGDITNSVTGDKRAQKFEDDYLDELFDILEELGFNAVTYMPSRNTKVQLDRIKKLCDAHGLFQISGEDINSPRQSFICPALDDPEFANLVEATWALIGHEKAATENKDSGMFSAKTIGQYPSPEERTAYFAHIGRGM